MRFIDASYVEQRDKLPARIGHEQLSRVFEEATRVVLCTNGNVDHLLPTAAFTKVLGNVLRDMPERLLLVIPSDWVLGYLRQNSDALKPSADQVKFRDDVANLPSFAFTEDNMGRHRAFVFGRMGIEEMFAHEANRLWTFLQRQG